MTQLREAILQMEQEQAIKRSRVNEEFIIMIDSVNPIHLIKTKLGEVMGDADLKKTLLNSFAGMAAGYISKKIVVKKADGALKQLLGIFLQVSVGGLVSQNAQAIKNSGKAIYESLFAAKEGD